MILFTFHAVTSSRYASRLTALLNCVVFPLNTAAFLPVATVSPSPQTSCLSDGYFLPSNILGQTKLPELDGDIIFSTTSPTPIEQGLSSNLLQFF